MKSRKGGEEKVVLEGNPVRRYELDRRINSIDINEETNTIVATEAKSDDPIIEFKI